MSIIYTEYSSEDFEGYVECLNNLYHGKHPHPKYFQKDYLENLIDEGKLIITLAKGEDGRVVGTATAQEMDGVFENSVMLGMRYVLDGYRGMGIGNAQENFLLKLVDEKFPNAHSVYAEVVTNNDISQRTLNKKGFFLCGLDMMLYRQPMYSPKFPEDDYKITMALYVKNIRTKNVSVNPPKKYADKVKEIYGKIGVNAEILENGSADETVFFSNVLARHDVTEFFVTVPGKNSENLSKAIEKCLEAGDNVSVFINISQNGCEELAEMLEKNNFYFCGLKPLNEKCEYIIMCNTQNHAGKKENIQIAEACRELADYFIGGM